MEDAVPTERVAFFNDTGARPARLPNPAARPILIRSGRCNRILHPNRQFWTVHGTVIFVIFEPVIPPIDHFLEKADGGSRLAQVRILMAPRPDQTSRRHVKPAQQAEDSVRITIGPTADGKDRHFDIGIVLIDGTVAPVFIFALVL